LDNLVDGCLRLTLFALGSEVKVALSPRLLIPTHTDDRHSLREESRVVCVAVVLGHTRLSLLVFDLKKNVNLVAG
jgi:hypothetical protein